DKIVTSRILQAAGVPTPATYVASRAEELAPLLDAGPLVLKPHQGGGGYGVRFVRSAAELAEVPYDRHAPVFAQRYHAPQGRDRKIYAIGGRLFGVKKVFPPRTEAEKRGEPFTLTSELRDIALRCGRAFGIDLYGVDVIESEGTPYVVDMCSVPGFKGVPDAPRGTLAPPRPGPPARHAPCVMHPPGGRRWGSSRCMPVIPRCSSGAGISSTGFSMWRCDSSSATRPWSRSAIGPCWSSA